VTSSPAPDQTPAPAPSSATPASPHAAPQKSPELPWPAHGAAAVSGLQARADAGSQPWLLDPLDLAQAYASTVHGWKTAAVSSTGPDEIRISADGTTVVVTVSQPARTGNGGIWVVTGERPA
jgi:hypothetical protein